MDNKTGKFILSLRTEKGLSQYQLAEMIPISRQAVSKWERGENIPDSYTLLKLSEIFNVSINELLLGERQLDNSIESLEKTTLTILDQSNKKTRKIKRLLLIFTTIITVLLLLFLSYYFITSYNSIKVYIIGADNSNVYMKSGIFITTGDKYYFKFGTLQFKKDKKVDSIEFCYKKSGKEYIIAKDKDIDDLALWDYHGYSEKVLEKNIKHIINDSYLKITYDDGQEEILKLLFRRDFMNSDMFQEKKHIWNTTKQETKQEVKQEVKEEEKKEETKGEEQKPVEIKQQPESKPQETKIQEEKPVIQEVQEPVQEEITIDKIISKIKELGDYADEGYYYEVADGNNVISYMYDGKMNQLMMFDLMGDSWIYLGNAGRYNCDDIADNDLCENKVLENVRKYLFK